MAQTFQLRAMALFLTFAQCPLPKDTILAHLTKKLDVEWALVAQEEHKDGNPHLHAVVKLNKRLSTRDPRLLDIEGYHPSMERCKSIHASVKYVTKADPDPLAYQVDL